MPIETETEATRLANLAALASQLRRMHTPGDPLVLVNAWDVASAQHVVAAGCRAVGTSSAAIAASLGLPDDPTAPVPALFDAVARITAAVDVPATADLLDGYGLDPAELVERLLASGAVGCNVEDSDHARPGRLLDADVAAARITAIRTAATAAGVDIVINARADCYLYADGDAASDVVARGRRYVDAGADCVYPVRLTDPKQAAALIEKIAAPVNVNWAPGVAVADLAASGASRVSVGPMAHRATLNALDEFARRLLGTAVT
jgi:2-methylisocitrate lyase-like PEP mutase family enzyme